MTDPVDPLATTERMEAAFSPAARVAAMLRFEAGLARAQARVGIVPPEAARAIEGACDVGRFDLPALFRRAEVDGNLAIPLVRELTALVPEEARSYVHLGATSQDAIDTGLVLQAAEGLEVLRDDLLAVGRACAGLAERHAGTPMVGRTLLQHAAPITFGLKAARWLASVTRELERLAALRRALPVQLGGPVGTLATMGPEGPRVVVLLAEELGLAAPDLPWHAERAPVAELAAGVAIAAGSAANVAADILLLSQTEVGEAAEGGPPGGGGSSSMPQKRNPVHAPLAVAAARIAAANAGAVLASMAHEHERAVGAWQVEWAAVPQLFRAAAAAVGHVRAALEDLRVDPARMRANLELGGGQAMAASLASALAPVLGGPEAFRVVAEVCRRAAAEGLDLLRAAEEEPRVAEALSPEALREALDPERALGAAELFVGRALDRFRAVEEAVGP